MDESDYRAIDAVNISTLLAMAKSAAHYRHAIEAGREDTAALHLGRVAHMALFEPERYAAEVAVWTDGHRRGKAYDAWCAEVAGKVQVNEAEHLQALALSVAVREHPVSGPLLAAGGLVEHSIVWKHRAGTRCKSRLDWLDLDSNTVLDLKTTRDASELEFGRAAARYRYHTRAAFYSDAYEAKYGVMPTFLLVAVEKSPPYATAVYRVSEDAIEAGRREYEDLLGRLKVCRERNDWPGIAADQLTDLVLPPWAFGADAGLDLVIDGESVHVG